MARELTTLAALSLLVLGCGGAPPPQSLPAAPAPAPLAAAAAAPAPQPTTLRRAYMVQGTQRGSLVVTRTPDGVVTTSYDVQVNGRGPHCDSTTRLAPDGTIASYEAKGHHWFGGPIDESFAVDNGRAHWKSLDESGEATPNGPAFFVPMADDPQAIAMLAEALLRAPGGTLPILPGGLAHIEKEADLVLQAGDKQTHVTAYAVTGLELTPSIEWMNDDGTWFGSVGLRRDGLLPEGWESAVDTLYAKRLEIERNRDRDLAPRLQHTPPAAGLAFTHARVLDVDKGKWLLDQTVVVVGDTIQAMGPARTTRVPAGAESVDLGGKALLPGLWDMHTHIAPFTGVLDIGSGITTTRDTGNIPDTLDDYKKRFDDGTAVGPHVLRAGLIEGVGDKSTTSGVRVDSEDAAQAAVLDYAKRGYEMIKIYNSVKTELVPVIIKAAHEHGMTVTGHIPVHMLANEAVKAGYDGIEHANQLLLNFFADHDTDTRTLARFTLVADKTADLDLKSKPVTDFFALLRDHHTVVDPTFVVQEFAIFGEQGKVASGLEWVAARMPVNTRRGLLTGGLPQNREKADTYLRSFDKMLKLARALQDAKITVVAGTDINAGLTLHHELELFVRGGLSPVDALRDATIVPARVMKLDKKTGSIAVGKIADLVVVDGDPLANISDVRKVVTTVRGGVVYQAKPVLESVGVAYWL